MCICEHMVKVYENGLLHLKKKYFVEKKSWLLLFLDIKILLENFIKCDF